MFMRCCHQSVLSAFAVLVVLMLSVGVMRVDAVGVTPSSHAAVVNQAAAPSCDRGVSFAASSFSDPTNINNRLLPLVPGRQLTLEGSADRGDGSLPHRVVFTVTDLTKVINGVRTVVVWDQDTNDGQLAESELAFFAQDDAGNVWNLGEYPELYEDGQFTGAPDTWLAGVDGARAGVHMLAKPRFGSRYLQGWSPEIDFLDCAMVVKNVRKVCVPADCYQDVLWVDESSPLDPLSGHQWKYHAPGVGVVQVRAVGDPEGETLVLTEDVTLSAQALQDAGEAALSLDQHAYEVSDLWANTPPAE